MLKRSLAIGLLVAVAAILGTGWFYAGLLERRSIRVMQAAPWFQSGLRVLAVEPGRVSLTFHADDTEGMWAPDQAGTWGLVSDSGYGRLGAVLETRDAVVVRGYERWQGSIAVGDAARMDKWAFPPDPRAALGLPFDEVVIDGPLGPLPAWVVPGAGESWAIVVHGRTGERGEGLRVLGALHAAGLTTLMATYRNDLAAYPDPSGQYRLGLTEWRDIEADAAYALAHGAKSLVLVGLTAGSMICLTFNERSPLASFVRAQVYDSPMLSFAGTVAFAAERMGVPSWLNRFGLWMFARRYRFAADELDVLAERRDPRSPTLIFQGGRDTIVPAEQSERYAAANPALVRRVFVPEAVHVGSWNHDPAFYERTVVAFLDEVLAPGSKGRDLAGHDGGSHERGR